MRIPPRKNCKKHLKPMNESNMREVEKNTKMTIANPKVNQLQGKR